MMYARPQHRTQGFTLVEVLVALVIVAVGMAAVLGALSSAAESTTYFRDKTFAQWVALNRITEVRLQKTRVSEGKSKGESELAGRKWRWEQEVTELEIPGVMRLDVKVQFADTAQSNSWLATSTGIVGEAVTAPDGTNPNFDLKPQGGPGQGGPDQGGGAGSPDDGSGGGNEPPPTPGTDEPPEPPPTPPPGDGEQ